eukprot:2416663-Prymnesium_polylepis.1
MTKHSADSHALTCEYSGDGKRQPSECQVKALITNSNVRLKVDSKVEVKLQPSDTGAGWDVRCLLFTTRPPRSGHQFAPSLVDGKLPPLRLTLEVNRPLKPRQSYGPQAHRTMVDHKTPQAQQRAAQTVINKRINLKLVVGNSRRRPGYVSASLDLLAYKEPATLTRGWAIRPPQERTRFSAEQRSFLVELFDWPQRLNEHQAHELFKKKFTAGDGPYRRKLRLSRAQIKAFFSTEKARRLKAGAAAVFEAATPAAPPAAATPAAAARTPAAAQAASPAAAPA